MPVLGGVPEWLVSWATTRLAARTRPWILGIQGPQGCGKSTLAAGLVDALAGRGARAVTVSIDDFYLTYTEQTALAERHAGNGAMLYRGYPGTHDVALGTRTLDALVGGGEARVPVYDKSAHAGRGDRAPPEAWRRVKGPHDVIVLEGWMLGFTPVAEDGLETALHVPNAYLAAYAAWTARLDAFLHMHIDSLDTIVRWRIDSERARRAKGESTLTDEEARDYIERFLPAYRTWEPPLHAHPPSDDARMVSLDEDRRITL
jgi:D-glycerate 3-kinase